MNILWNTNIIFQFQECGCKIKGSRNQTCDERTGACQCKEKFEGKQCDQCEPNVKNDFPNCQGCDKCHLEGTEKCNSEGECVCKQPHLMKSFACDDCKDGAYGFPDCKGTFHFPHHNVSQ